MEDQEQFVENLDFASPETYTQPAEIPEPVVAEEPPLPSPKPKSASRKKQPEPEVVREVEPVVQQEKPAVKFGIHRFRDRK